MLLKTEDDLAAKLSKVEQQLKQEIARRSRAEQYLDTVLENIPAGVAILEGEELRYCEINHRLAKINGFSKNEHLGKTLKEVLPDVEPLVAPEFHKVFKTASATPMREFSTKMPKGPKTLHWFIVSFFPVFDNKKNVVAVGVVVVEITKRKETEIALNLANEKLVQSNRALAETNKKLQITMERGFIAKEKLLTSQQQQLAHALRVSTMEGMASGITHELNQPLAAITNYAAGCSQLLQEKNADHAMLSNALKKILAEALRCGEIIKRLKNLMQGGEVKKETFALKNIVEDTTCLMKSDLRAAGIEIETKIGKHVQTIVSDKILLSQVLLNLIKNAMEAIKDSNAKVRMIDIVIKLIDNNINIRVRDYGPGVPQTMEQDIFNPYCSTKKNNLGMGLSISRSIIETLEGSLSLIKQKGLGACFEISLPIGSE